MPRLGDAPFREAREANVVVFRKTLEPLRTILAAQPYLGDRAPAYADYAVFGCFQWARCMSPFPLLLKDDPIWVWRERFAAVRTRFRGLCRGLRQPFRKSAIAVAICSTWVSSAKWPVSRKRTWALGRSRL